MPFYLLPSLIFEVIAFLAAVYFFLKKKNTLVFYFLIFLFVTVCVETMGTIVMSLPPYQNRTNKLVMYNVFFTVEFVFYSFIFYLHFKRKLFRQIALVFIPVVVVFAVANMLFGQGLGKVFNTYTSLLGSFFIVLFCCFFFYESIQPEQIDDQLSKQPFFWISSGLLIFYLGSVIINALFEYLRTYSLQNPGIRIYSNIIHFLNVILYSSFCIAFYLCPDRKKTYSSASS
jgi:hypothetical protein